VLRVEQRLSAGVTAIGLGAVTFTDSVFCQSDARGDVPAVKVASSCAKN
jgi:hypothetical protein